MSGLSPPAPCRPREIHILKPLLMRHILLLLSLSLASPLLFSQNLTSQEVRVLRTEYILQRFREDLMTLPRKFIARARQEELSHHQRHKRHTRRPRNVCSTETEEDGHQPCCVDQVQVDFQELGWDFILSPRSLQFSFCRGSCNPHLVRPALFTKAASQILYVRLENIFRIKILIFSSLETSPAAQCGG